MSDGSGNFMLEVNLGGMLQAGIWEIYADSAATPHHLQAHARLEIEPANDCVPVGT